MKTIDFGDVLVVPACVVGDEVISAVLDGESGLLVSATLFEFGGISLAEAEDIGAWLVYQSGRSARNLKLEMFQKFKDSDTAVREVVLAGFVALTTIQ
jgi:hypothetical protein